MKTLFIILLLSTNICLAKTDNQCISKIVSKMSRSYTEDEFVKMVTSCNIVILEGFNHKNMIKKIETRVLVSINPELYVEVYNKKSFSQKANKLLEYEYCVDISSIMSQYIKKCKKGF